MTFIVEKLQLSSEKITNFQNQYIDHCSELNSCPFFAGLRKSRSTEALTDAITDLSLAKEPLKDVKSMVPITFQDLVNSVQPTP